MTAPNLLIAAAVLAAPLAAIAADAADRSLIRRGMKEAEVVTRIGLPDRELFLQNTKGQPEEKEWTYLPAPRDAQMVTTVTLKSGLVTDVQRRISR